jgi:hypothetical protein
MHTPALLDEARDGSPVSTLTPVYPLRFVKRIHPWSSTSKWVDALGRTVFLALGSRQPKVVAESHRPQEVMGRVRPRHRRVQ